MLLADLDESLTPAESGGYAVRMKDGIGRFFTDGEVSCAAVAWRFRGRLCATVVVKATFALKGGAKASVLPPEEVVQQDRTIGGHPARSLERAAETAPSLSRCDVLLNGHVQGGGRSSASVRLLVSRGQTALVDKTIHVFGDRDAAGNPRPIERIPLVYERAAGGPGVPANPVGTSKPNLVDPRDASKPACFAPVSRLWPARRGLLAPLGGAASGLTSPAPAAILDVPDATPWAYFQAAPPDQQADPLRGDEWIVLDGLHPTEPRLQTQLPGATAAARILTSTGEVPLQLVADMLILDADRLTASVVFRARHDVPDEQALSSLVVLAGLELPGRPVDFAGLAARRLGAESTPAAQRSVESAPAAGPAGDETIAATPSEAAAVPFTATGAPSAQPVISASVPGERTVTLLPDQSSAAARRQAAPFPVAAHGPDGADREKDTSATPWGRDRPRPILTPVGETTLTPLAPESASPAAAPARQPLPLSPPSPVVLAPPLAFATPPLVIASAPLAPATPPLAPATPPLAPATPPLAPATPPPVIASSPLAPADSPSPAAPCGAAAPELPLDERAWARLSARRMKRSREECRALVEEAGLDEETFRACDEHYRRALEADVESGKMELASLYGAICAEEMRARAAAKNSPAPPAKTQDLPPTPPPKAEDVPPPPPEPPHPELATPSFMLHDSAAGPEDRSKWSR